MTNETTPRGWLQNEDELRAHIKRSGIAVVSLRGIPLPRLLAALDRLGGPFRIVIHTRSGRFELALGHHLVLGAAAHLEHAFEGQHVLGLEALCVLGTQRSAHCATVKKVPFPTLANLVITPTSASEVLRGADPRPSHYARRRYGAAAAEVEQATVDTSRTTRPPPPPPEAKRRPSGTFAIGQTKAEQREAIKEESGLSRIA